MTAFGKRLQEQREKLGISQKDMAEKLGASIEWLCRIERGKLDPPNKPKTLSAIGAFYEVPLPEIYVLAGLIPVLSAPLYTIRPDIIVKHLMAAQKEIELSFGGDDGE